MRLPQRLLLSFGLFFFWLAFSYRTQLANLFHMSAILGTSFFIVRDRSPHVFFRLAPSRAKDSMRKLDNILPMQEGVILPERH